MSDCISKYFYNIDHRGCFETISAWAWVRVTVEVFHLSIERVINAGVFALHKLNFQLCFIFTAAKPFVEGASTTRLECGPKTFDGLQNILLFRGLSQFIIY